MRRILTNHLFFLPRLGEIWNCCEHCLPWMLPVAGPSTSAGAVWGPWVGRRWVTTRQLISCNRRSLAETRKGKTCWLYSRDLHTPFWRSFWVSESFAFSTLLNFHIYPRQFWWELRTKQWSSHWGHPNPHTVPCAAALIRFSLKMMRPWWHFRSIPPYQKKITPSSQCTKIFGVKVSL